MERNQILNMDCLEGFDELDERSVDVVVTSPPYNIGMDYNDYDDKRPEKEYFEWLNEVFRGVSRILAEDGSFFLNVGGSPSDELLPMKIATKAEEIFELQNVIHWIKSIALPKEETASNPGIVGDVSVGHYKPVNSERYLNNCQEYIFHLTRDGEVKLDKLAIGVPYQDKNNISRWDNGDQDLRDRGNTWFISYETITSSRPHPTSFPIRLPEKCIKLHGTDRTEYVLDPFMGIGSTALACKKLGIDFIGFEIDQKYINVAKERIQEADNQTPLFSDLK